MEIMKIMNLNPEYSYLYLETFLSPDIPGVMFGRMKTLLMITIQVNTVITTNIQLPGYTIH